MKEMHEKMMMVLNETMNCHCTKFLYEKDGYCYYYNELNPERPVRMPIQEVLDADALF